MENLMRLFFLVAAMFVFVLDHASGQGKLLTSDPLTGLPLIPATNSGKHNAGMAYTYNEPTQIPRRSALPAHPLCVQVAEGR
jgi:hypothetical protein